MDREAHQRELELIGVALCNPDFFLEYKDIVTDIGKEFYAARHQLEVERKRSDFTSVRDRMVFLQAHERLNVDEGYIGEYLSKAISAAVLIGEQRAQDTSSKKIDFDAYLTSLTARIFTQFEQDKTMGATTRRKVIRSIRKQVLEASTQRAVHMYFGRRQHEANEAGRLEHVKPFMVEVDNDD